MTWFLGQGYFFGTLIVVGALWLALRQDKTAMAQSHGLMVAA
jgi:hypothetical protein